MADYTVKQEGELSVIVDSLGNFVEAFDSRAEAFRVAREMNGIEEVNPVRRYEGRYGRGDVAAAVEVEEEEVAAPAAKVEIVIAAKPAKEGKITKADRVRECIAQVKAQGGDLAAVVAWAVEQLGMPRAQAVTYAKNNWNKV